MRPSALCPAAAVTQLQVSCGASGISGDLCVRAFSLVRRVRPPLSPSPGQGSTSLLAAPTSRCVRSGLDLAGADPQVVLTHGRC